MEQLELFPRATIDDITLARALLDEYKKCTRTIKVFDLKGYVNLDESDQRVYNKCKLKIDKLNNAVELILDPEIKEIIRFRYVEGNSYSLTIQRFTRIMDDRTVDRKLNKGIESVAESLVLK